MNKSIHWGINTYPNMPLNGCVPDMEKWSEYTARYCNVMPSNMRLACDERCITSKMHEHLRWMCEDIEKGDLRIITYSGHGTTYAGRGSNNEITGLNNVIVPWDFNWREEFMLSDKQLYDYNRIMQEKGAKVFEVIDACNSGGFSRAIPDPIKDSKHPLDLTTQNRRGRGTWNSKIPNKIRTIPIPADMRHRINVAKAAGFETLHAPLDMVTIITGCKQDQFSLDMSDDQGNPGGALSIYCVKNLMDMNGEILDKVIEKLNIYFDSMNLNQNPQLEGRKGIAFGT